MHNHPSGDPSPSDTDVSVTKMALKAAEILRIDLLDHIIVGAARYASLKERKLMEEQGFDGSAAELLRASMN
jgi:DNA repair protein RadC